MRVIMSPEARLGTATSAHGMRRILFDREERPAPQVPAEEPAVRDEAAEADLEHVGDRVELVEVREHVEHARADDRRDRRDDVAVGHRLLRKPVALGERQREVPADDERQPEHDAVRVERQLRRLERHVAPHVRADPRAEPDDAAPRMAPPLSFVRCAPGGERERDDRDRPRAPTTA